MPLVVLQIRCQNRGFATVAFFDQLKEDVGLFGAKVKIRELVDKQQIDASQTAHELPRGTIGQRGIHLLEEILSLDEQTAITILECLEQQTRRESSLADSGWTDKDDISGFRDELQFCQFEDLTTRNSGLVFERERLQSPELGEIGALDACL